MIGPDVYESPRATYVSGGGGGLVGKHAAANSPNVSTTAIRRPVTKPPQTTELFIPRRRIAVTCSERIESPSREFAE
jgi:precorrin-6x reductase